MMTGVIVLEGGSFDVIPAMAAAWGRTASAPVFGMNPAVWWDASPVSHRKEFIRYPSFLMLTASAPGVAARRAGAGEFISSLKDGSVRGTG